MSFCSIEFGLFVAAVLVVYYLPVKSKLYQNIVLLLASLYFAYLFDKGMMVLFILTILLTYAGGLLIGKTEALLLRRCFLLLFIVIDAGILILMKYSGFFSTVPGLSLIGTSFRNLMVSHSLFLPIGISFYTLSLIGYLVDVYRNKIQADQDVIRFFLFGSFFPHILQGPIARYQQFTDQIKERRSFDYDKSILSLQLILWGLVKKLIIADRAAIFVNNVYSADFTGNGTAIFVASLLYTIQIYTDFSGCVDIARGVAGIFGINLIENFNAPYLSKSINEFWRRWHISLSSWFRDYIYISLGGNRKGNIRRWLNVLVVFLVSGFWHGAGLAFILWGLLHGFYQIVGSFWQPMKKRLEDILNRFGVWNQNAFDLVITFLLVNFAWILFRSESTKMALKRIFMIFTDFKMGSLFDGSLLNYGISFKAWLILLLFIAIMVVADVMKYRSVNLGEWVKARILPVRWVIWIAAILAVLVFGIYGVGYNAADFIYMKF